MILIIELGFCEGQGRCEQKGRVHGAHLQLPAEPLAWAFTVSVGSELRWATVRGKSVTSHEDEVSP